MKVKISNGEATIKDFYPRKIDKEVKKILFKDVRMSSEGAGKDSLNKTEGFNFVNSEEANDHAMLKMIKGLFINGADVEVTMDALDNLSVKDYNTIKKAIDEVAGVNEDPKE